MDGHVSPILVDGHHLTSVVTVDCAAGLSIFGVFFTSVEGCEKNVKPVIHCGELPLTIGGAHWLLTAQLNAYWLTDSVKQ